MNDEKEAGLVMAGLTILIAPQVVAISAAVAVGLKFGAWAGFAALAALEALIGAGMTAMFMAMAGGGDR